MKGSLLEITIFLTTAYENHWFEKPTGLAEGPGFEPGLTGPEPVVLPLDDPSVCLTEKKYTIHKIESS